MPSLRPIARTLLVLLSTGCRGTNGTLPDPLFLNVAPQNRALYLTWNAAPHSRTLTTHCRRTDGEPWQSATGGDREWRLVDGLENGVAYECYAERELDTGETIISETILETPRDRPRRAREPYFTSQQAADDWLKLKGIDPGALRLRGQPVGTWGPDVPDGAYTLENGKVALFLLRHADSAFRARRPAPRPPAEVRRVLRGALWPKQNPFDDPDEFAMSITPIPWPLTQGVTDFASARSFAIAYHPQLSSRCTHFIPAAPARGVPRDPAWQRRFAIYIHGHEFRRMDNLATIQRLLQGGWQVIAVDMPLHGANGVDQSPTLSGHNTFFSWPAEEFRPVALFLQPLKALVDKIYRENGGADADLTIMLIGKSGGGWTSYMYGALDERVDYVVSIAGGMPMSQWLEDSRRALDYELIDPLIYEAVPYEDIMPAAGSRGAFFVYNERDPCCFRMRHDAPFVRYLLDAGIALRKPIGVYVDRENTTHSISNAALVEIDAFITKLEAQR